MDIKIDKEYIEKIKNQFINLGNFEKEIDAMIDGVDAKIINMKFDPRKNNINEIYDIMDTIQDWQSDIGKILIKALDYEEATELLEATVISINEGMEKELLIGEDLKTESVKKGFKNKEEKIAWVFNKINDNCGINDIIKYMNKQRIKSKYALKRVNIISDIVEKQDFKLSRKVSVMGIQSQKGTLGNGGENGNK